MRDYKIITVALIVFYVAFSLTGSLARQLIYPTAPNVSSQVLGDHDVAELNETNHDNHQNAIDKKELVEEDKHWYEAFLELLGFEL